MLDVQKAFVLLYWRTLVAIGVPLILMPVVFSDNKEDKCLYVLAVMMVYYFTEVVHIVGTAFIPLIVFPLLTLMSNESIAKFYGVELNLFFVMFFFVALSLEYSLVNLHIGAWLVAKFGCNFRRLHFLICISTMFLSMWVSNTAATIAMLPVVRGILAVIHDNGIMNSVVEVQSQHGNAISRPSELAMCYYFSIHSSAVFGGTGTIIGSPSITAFRTFYMGMFPLSPKFFNFGWYMLFGVPNMLFLTSWNYLWLEWYFLGLFRSSGEKYNLSPEGRDEARNKAREQKSALGPLNFHQKAVSILFVGCIVGFITRHPIIFDGWADIYKNHYGDKFILKDSVVTAIVVLLLFCLPAEPAFVQYFKATDNKPERASPSLVLWKYLHMHTVWKTFFLIGSSHVIYAAVAESGLNELITRHLENMATSGKLLMLVRDIGFSAFVGTFVVDAQEYLLPGMAKGAIEAFANPFFFCMASYLGSSWAFLMPTTLPSSAIILAASNSTVIAMALAGIGSFLFSLLLTLTGMVFLAPLVFNDMKMEASQWAYNQTN